MSAPKPIHIKVPATPEPVQALVRDHCALVMAAFVSAARAKGVFITADCAKLMALYFPACGHVAVHAALHHHAALLADPAVKQWAEANPTTYEKARL